jgi:ATP-binding cassette subfamily B protein
MVGERGVTLSGGQRQRIAIARALLVDPRILILDDATSSVDAHTEELIHQALRRLLAGRTSYVIAQRLSTLELADVVVVMDEGRITARGSHDELMQTSPTYRAICNEQLQRESPAATT